MVLELITFSKSEQLQVVIMPRTKQSAPTKFNKSVAKSTNAAVSKARNIALGGVKKKARRFRPGTVSVREIKRLQKSTSLIIPKATFTRVVREISDDFVLSGGVSARWKKSALAALHEASEDYLTEFFAWAQLFGVKEGRTGINLSDGVMAKVKMENMDIYRAYGYAGKIQMKDCDFGKKVKNVEKETTAEPEEEAEAAVGVNEDEVGKENIPPAENASIEH